MMVYIWSGESVAALIMAIVTLFAVVAIIEWKPWAVGDEDDTVGDGDGDHTVAERSSGRGRAPGAGTGASSPADHARREGDADAEPVWRGVVDIASDHRGITGVALGLRESQRWSWSQIVDIHQAWFPPSDHRLHDPTDDRSDADGVEASEDRIGLCLSLPRSRNPEQPAEVGVTFGPHQDPGTVVHELRSAWRRSKVARSRFHDLTLEERTRQMAQHFGADVIDLRAPASSAELLYQEVRRSLLSGGRLCRLTPDATLDDVLDRFDALLEANAAEPLTRAEAEALTAADGPDRLACLHWTLDSLAEQRGFRLAYLDQGGDDHLLGLVPAHAADDWDGQTVGGSARVVLDLPR